MDLATEQVREVQISVAPAWRLGEMETLGDGPKLGAVPDHGATDSNSDRAVTTYS
jgi:hypothetical protein